MSNSESRRQLTKYLARKAGKSYAVASHITACKGIKWRLRMYKQLGLPKKEREGGKE